MITETMKQFTNNFMQTLIFNIATICGIVVGVIQFSIKAFNENNGAEKMRNFTLTVLKFVDAMVAQVTEKLDTDVPPVEVAQ
jgi:hypothetical protein